MRCPSCGANVNGAFCEYCGARMPVERVETQTFNAQNVYVNNNYYQGVPMGQAGYPRSQQYGAGEAASPKSKTVTLILWLFVGIFGGHRFYIGTYGLAIAYLLTFGLCGIGWLVDLALLLLDRLRDGDGLVVSVW